MSDDGAMSGAGDMPARIKWWGFPEVLLWMVIPVAFYYGLIIPGLMLLITWMVHIGLRRDPRFPSFGSLFQVLLSIISFLGLAYMSHQLEGAKHIRPDDNLETVVNATVYDLGKMVFLFPAVVAVGVFFILQIGLWVVAVRSFRRRRLAMKRLAMRKPEIRTVIK